MRYFVELSYCGDAYAGWQRQKNALAIQEVIEDKFGTVLQEQIVLTGCGRTDTGVHATQYFVHLDTNNPDFDTLQYAFNSILPHDISVLRILKVHDTAHARYDASLREYIYRITLEKNPFLVRRAFEIYNADILDTSRMQAAAEMLLNYQDFYSFCKTRTEVKTTLCKLSTCHWDFKEREMIFTIQSDRFLRGMVRLIVGMCLQAGWGKVQLEEVRQQLEQKQRLQKPWSVPAHGLYLSKVEYPYIN